MSFPASPTIGQEHVQDNRIYEWDGAVWVLTGVVTPTEVGEPLPSSEFFKEWLPPSTDFPDNPSLGQTYSNGVHTWEWDGVSWVYHPSGVVDWDDVGGKPDFDDEYLPKTGGTLTGPLTLPGSPTNPNQAASKQYVDDKTLEFQNAYVGKAGDEMSGSLRIRGDDQGVEFSNDAGDFAEITVAPDGNVRVSVGSGKTLYYGGATPPQSPAFSGTLLSRLMGDNRYLRYVGLWDVATTYKVNEIVSYLGNTWLCIAETTTATPEVAGTDWIPFGGSSGGLPPAGTWDNPALQTYDENTGIQTYVLPAAAGDGLTWTYSLISSPASITLDAGTRTVSADTDVMERGLTQYTVMAEDQYGRSIINEGLIDITPTVPALVTAVDDTVFWTLNSAITAYDVTQNFTLNGNTGSYGVTGLPTGLSFAADQITGTPTVGGTGSIIITHTDSFAREVTSTLSYEVAAAPAIFSNFVWDEATGRLLFDATEIGTYTWHFGSNTGTFDLVAGANSPTINLNTYAGQTDVFRITKDGQELYVDANLTIPNAAIALSSPIGAQTGQTTASGSVTSDTATGTLYAGVWPTADTPSAAQIVAGTGAVYHTTDGTPTAGVNNFSATGLTAATAYKWHYYQVDGADVSNIARSAEFTTAAAPTLVEPVILDIVFSGSNSNLSSLSAGYPAHNAGDMLLVYSFSDNRKGLLLDYTVTPLSGDTAYKEYVLDDTELNTSNDQGIAISSIVTTATRSAAGSGLVVTLDASSDQPFVVAVVRVQADTFKETNPRLGFITKDIENAVASVVQTAALTGVQEKARILAAMNLPFNAPTQSLPSGWVTPTGGEPTDYGATVGWFVERTAAATASENISAQTLTSDTFNPWISVIAAIMPKGS